MNQPNLSVMNPKTQSPTTEGFDLLGLLKRYALLLIAGAVTGAVVSGAYYWYSANYQAEFTARIPFQVLPPPSSIGMDNPGQTIRLDRDDSSQVINRQEFLFQQDDFLSKVLESAEFHPQDKPGQKCDWMRENTWDRMWGLSTMDALKALKRDLRVVPRINAASFEITMTAHDPHEAQTLLIAAEKVYRAELSEDSKRRKSSFLTELDNAVRAKQGEFEIKSSALVEYSRAHQIDVMKSKFEIEKSALQELNNQFTMSDAAASNAEAQFATIDKLRKEDKELPLSPELMQSVENDYTLKTLMNQRLGYDQDMAALMKSKSMSDVQQKQLQARIDKNDEQITNTRKDLTKAAQERLVKMLSDEAVNKRFLANFIGEFRQKKEAGVTALGQDLLIWEQRVDEVKQVSEVVNQLKKQLSLTQANLATDDTRVAMMIKDDPRVPDRPSWPRWYMFLAPGTLIGLGLSMALAYLFVLTDSRVRTPRDLSKTLQMPVLGFIPDESDDRMLTGDVETAILSSPASVVAESFRQIRSQITAQTAHNPVASVVVASIGPGGGATTVASNLAAAMALNDLRVLLVDANLYRPSLDRLYKGLPKTGLTDVVADPSILEESIVPHPSLPRLHVMGVGSALSKASSEVFEGKTFREVLDCLKGKYDLVIFDGAPFNLVADSMALASRVDGVITVVRAGEVSRGAVTRVRDQMRSVHANLLGFVLNAAQTSSTGYYKENYRTFYRYAAGGPRAKAVV
jgi:capsular exopolysaccharide synthesis family protein